MAQPYFGVGRDRGADHAQLPALEVNPQRQPEVGEARQRSFRSLTQRHHGIEPQPRDDGVLRHLLQEGGVRWGGDDGGDSYSLSVASQ